VTKSVHSAVGHRLFVNVCFRDRQKNRRTPFLGRFLPLKRSRSGSPLRLYVVGVCINRIGTVQFLVGFKSRIP